jgi:phosphoribosylformylglycinamidine synthase
MQITDKTIEEHGLSADEYKKILKVLGREPNMVELGVFSVMWSEHCSYKSSRVHLGNFPTTGPDVIQGPGENAGVVDIGGGLAAVFKMESHNHPSFIEPYQGAATGVGGIMRDVFTMGARPIASLNSLRFGSVDHPKTAYLVEGVTAGIAGYGNCMGVPTVGGEVYFNDCYNGNNLVNAMTVGIVAKDKIFLGKASGIGNPVIYVGSKTGRDGIHGATMASDVFGEGGEERRPTVQVGDPFAEKLLLEACLELFKTDYVVGIQDMGAAGLTSSSVEMASRAGTGIEIDIDKVPRREEGMSAYEILLSESQERMVVVVREGVEELVKEIFDKWDLDAHVIGRVVEGDSVRILEGGVVVADIPVAALTDAAPRYERPIERPSWQDGLNSFDLDALPEPTDYKAALLKLLADGDIASKRWIFRQYDHMVRTDTVVEPGSDAAVVRIKGTNTALAMTVDCNSIYCYIDPFKGGAMAVAEAARNLVVSGARPLALTDCLNFGNPERPEVMWQFRESVLGISEACKLLSIPVIGGNVSFYNETSGDAIHPTPTIGMVGLIDDLTHVTRQFFLNSGDLVALIAPAFGEERASARIGGSAYLRVFGGLEKGPLPEMDLEAEKKVQEACLNAIKTGIIISSHDISEGGLAVALAECCFTPAGDIGVSVDVDIEGARADLVFFNESASRIIVSLAPGDVEALGDICAGAGAALKVIGTVGGDTFRINRLIDVPVPELREAWSGAMEEFLSR